MNGERIWFAASSQRTQAKRHAPATTRNRDAIAAVLAQELPSTGVVLEIASGSGEHVVHFASLFPNIVWQPSDPDPAALDSIAAWSAEAGRDNIRPPIALDAQAEPWPVDRADAVLCINMTHISPWSATIGLMQGAASILPANGVLLLYGPFLQEGVETAPGNASFDRELRARDPQWGIRFVEAVDDAAISAGFVRSALHAMHANNLSLVYRPIRAER